MTKKLLFVTTILLVVALAAFAADVTGKWTYQQPGRNGGDPTPRTITLKADGATLTGTVPGQGGRGGAAPADMAIANGKVTGDKISFEVSRPGRQGGDPTIIKYEGTVSGDTLTLKITSPGRGGGDPTTQEVTAKREKS
jgi:hypothetical protein